MEESGCANPQKQRKKLFLPARNVTKITAMSAPQQIVQRWVIQPIGKRFAENSVQHEREEIIIFRASDERNVCRPI
jgi:hypothetical protein